MSPDWIYYLTLVAVLFFGLFVNIIGLPGLWLMVAAAGGYAWLTWPSYIGTGTLIALVLLALAAEAVEFIAGGAGAKKAGGSKRGIAGAIIGGLLGGLFLTFLLPIPIIGTIFGACLGTFLGAVGVEYLIHKDVDKSVRVGIGAAHGRLLGIISKLAFGIVILIVSVWAAFPTGRTAPPPAAALPATRPGMTPVVVPPPVPVPTPAPSPVER